jgi:hypothetical protein
MHSAVILSVGEAAARDLTIGERFAAADENYFAACCG